MATSHVDKKQNRGLRSFFHKNFNKPERGGGIIANTVGGFFKPFGWYQHDVDPFMFALLGSAVAIAGAAAVVDDVVLDPQVDFEIASYETADTAAADATSRVYEHNGELYLLRHTEEGTQVFVKSNRDYAERDDLFVLMDENNAPAIARQIGSIYKGITEQRAGEIDIWSQFESVRQNEPAVWSYDGISAVFEQEGEQGLHYIIADNVHVEENREWKASTETAEQGFAQWSAALTDMAHDRYIAHPQDAQQGTHYEDINYPYFLLLAQIMGGIGGVGMAVGAGSSIAASRRRYNEKLKYQV